jgi:amino acid transporter
MGQAGTAILMGTLIILLAYFTLLVPPRVFFRILRIGFLLTLAAWILIFIVLGSATPGAFQEGWDQFLGPNSYAQVIPAAQALGMNTDLSAQRMPLVGLAAGFWIFFGFFVSTFFAGEVKKPERNLLTGNWLGLVLVWAVLTGLAYLLSRVVPADWLSAVSFLRQAGAAANHAIPWLPFYVMVLAPGLPLVLLMFLAWLYATINLVQVMMGYMSRIMLAWADDGLLPLGMDYIHPRFRSPLLTLLVAAGLVQIGLVNALLGGFWGSQYSLPFMAALAMMIPVTAMTVYPYLKPDWFETSPALVRARLGPLPLVSLLGGIALFSLLWFVASALILRTIPGALNRGDGLALAIFVGTGLLWYWARRANLKAKGIHLADSFKFLP